MRVAKREKQKRERNKKIMIIMMIIILLFIIIFLVKGCSKILKNKRADVYNPKIENNLIDENEETEESVKNDDIDIDDEIIEDVINNVNDINEENISSNNNSNSESEESDLKEAVEEYKEIIDDTQKDESGKTVEWAKIEGSTIEQYRLYIKDKNGEYIRGNLEITTISGDTFNEFVTKEGSENVFIKSVIQSVKIK